MQNIFSSLNNNLTIFSPEVHIIHFKLANLYRSEETGRAFPSRPSSTSSGRILVHSQNSSRCHSNYRTRAAQRETISASFQNAEA